MWWWVLLLSAWFAIIICVLIMVIVALHALVEDTERVMREGPLQSPST